MGFPVLNKLMHTILNDKIVLSMSRMFYFVVNIQKPDSSKIRNPFFDRTDTEVIQAFYYIAKIN